MGGFFGGAPEAPAQQQYVPPPPAEVIPPPASISTSKVELSSQGEAELKRKRAPKPNIAPRSLLGTADGTQSNPSILGS